MAQRFLSFTAMLLLVGCAMAPDVAEKSGEAPAAGSKTDPWGKVTQFGTYAARSSGTVREKPGASTGKSILGSVLEPLEQTDRVPLRIGARFGYRYWLQFPPDMSRADIRRVLLHPEMTLPDGSRVSQSERMVRKRTTHGIVTALDAYALSENYELVAGEWTFQLWHQDLLLIEQKFTTYWTDQAESK